MAARPIVVVGSINLDIVTRVERIPAPGETVIGGDVQQFEGGKGANQAVGVARLGHSVHLVGRVGDDDAGRRLLEALRRANVNVAGVMTTRGVPSGTALIATDRAGENSIVVSPGANGRLQPSDIERHAARVRSAALVMLQLEVPLETVECAIGIAHRAGVPVMLDPAPARSLSRSLLRRVTWLTPNETEAAHLAGMAHRGGEPTSRATARALARTLRDRGSRHIIVTLGRHGACIASGDADLSWVSPFRVRAVDSTAAGDAFNAGLAVALAAGQPLVDAARFASAVAAVSVTRAGAQPSMPGSRAVAHVLGTPRRSRLSADS